MKSLIFSTTLMISSASFASHKPAKTTSDYTFQTQLKLDDEHVTNGNVSVKANAEGVVTQAWQNQSLFVEVIPHPLTKKKFPVEVQFNIGQYDEDGNKVLLSQKKIVASKNTTTSVNESEDLDHPKIDFDVTID